MAKLYGEIAAKSLLTLDKSFARANGQPLDASEVYYSLAAAQEYAATAQAYIGQKIVVIENGIVSHYSVEDTAGTLKELGAKPVADGTTVAIGTDGKITLANITDAEASGTYNAVLVNGKLTWVKPSETTVEGLSDLISALTGRVTTAEGEIDALQEAVGVAAGEGVEATGLFKAVADEIAAREAADETLEGKIADALQAAKDYADANDANTVYDDTALAARVKAIEDDYLVEADKYDDTDVKNRLTALEGASETHLVEADLAPYAKTESVNNALLLKADKADFDDLKDTVDAFLTGNGTEAALDSLKELIAYIDAHDGADLTEMIATIEGIENKLEGIDDTVVAHVTAAIDALKIGDYAKAADLTDLASRVATLEAKPFDTYATKSEVEAVDGKFANYTTTENLTTQLAAKADADKVVANDTFETFKGANTTAIGTAKSEAIEAAANAAAGIYATKAELTAHETAAAAAYATKDELSDVEDKADGNTNLITNLTNRLDGIVAQGGEPNTINTIKVNGVAQSIDSEKAVDIAVPTKFTDLTDNSGFDARITAAQSDATKGINDAKAAHDAAVIAQGEVDALEGVVGNLTTAVTGHGETLTDHTTRIGVLEGKETTHAAEYAALKKLAEDNATAVATKAESADLVTANGEIAKNTAAIKAINETTVPALEGEIAKKADADKVYTKTEINAITGAVPADKTLIDLINAAKTEATYDDSEVRGLIGDNKNAIEAIYKVDGETKSGVLATEIARVEGLVSTETGRAQDAESALAGRLDTVEAFWKEAIRDETEKNVIDTLKEIQEYIESDESGASAMAGSIKANEDAIKALYTAADGETPASGVLATEIKRVEDKADANTLAISTINNADTGLLAAAKKYTDDSIAGIPAATAATLGLVKFDNTSIKMNDSKQLYVAKVSTDLLENGTEELVLNGGTAL